MVEFTLTVKDNGDNGAIINHITKATQLTKVRRFILK